MTRRYKLGASNDGAELRVQILKSCIQEHIYKKISKNKLKNKKMALSDLVWWW